MDYFDVAGVVIVEFVGFGHFAVAELHDFEDVVAVLLFDEFDVHGWWGFVKAL